MRFTLGIAALAGTAFALVLIALEVTTLFLFALVGLGLFAAGGQTQAAVRLGAGLAIGCPAILGLFAAQRFGLIRVLAGVTDRLARRSGWNSPLLALDNAIRGFY